MKIYLTPDEIKRIAAVQLPDNLKIIRDRFVLGCVSGLRFSDYSRIGHDHVQKNVFVILNKKTNVPTVIPIHSLAADILKRYKNGIPPGPTIRYYNMMLPTIGLKAKINTPVTVEKKYQKRDSDTIVLTKELLPILDYLVIKTAVPKYALITTHTARRSFATNAYKAGIPAQSIMLITGHRTEESFFRYICIGGEENANELLNHEFFK